MHAYGVKRHYGATDDYVKNGEARSPRKQARGKKIMHRSARRTARTNAKLLICKYEYF